MLPFASRGPKRTTACAWLFVSATERTDSKVLLGVLVAGEVPADERDQRDRGREGERRADAAAGQAGRLHAPRASAPRPSGSLFELGWQLGRRAGLDQHLVHALEALVLSGREALSDQVLELG